MSDNSARSGPGALGRDIRARRRELRLTQQELADLAGTSARFVGLLEGGKPTVRLDKVGAVLDALGLELRAEVRRAPQPQP
jgi:HTH-type transcriptional regulator / antitoxin HipB